MGPRVLSALVAIGLALSACGPAKPPAGASLAWAYPKAPKESLPEAPPGPQHVPGSKLTFTKAQVDDDQNPVDWFPEEHPAPPAIVAHARPGGPTPCAECHMFNGQGFLAIPN